MFAFTGGDAMGGPTLVLDKAVSPGSEIELSIAITAPANKTGAVRGNWAISTLTGIFFGDEQFVLIILGDATATATSTATPTGTVNTATATSTTTPTSVESPTSTETPTPIETPTSTGTPTSMTTPYDRQ